MPSSTPMTTIANPLIGEPVPMDEAATRPSTIMANSSAGPNFRPTSAIAGENSTSSTRPIMAPTRDAIVVMNKALPALPCLAIG